MDSAPFGSPDGTHLTPRHTVALFESDIQSLVGSPRSCVVMGRRGSGKTAFVRRVLERLASDRSGVLPYADPTLAPSIDDLLAIELRVPAAARVDRWADTWHAAILRSLYTHLLYDRSLALLHDGERMLLRDSWDILLEESGESTVPVSVCAELSSIARREGDNHQYLRHGPWNELQAAMAELVAARSPVMIVLDYDAVTLPSAPGEWMRCQWGLIKAIDRLSRGALGTWLFIVATMREEHVVTLQSHGYDARLRDLLLTLETDRDDMLRFSSDLVRLVADRYSDQPGGAAEAAALLSGSQVRNEHRAVVEDCVEYILRHTRYVPRDFVRMANGLAARATKTGPFGPNHSPAVTAVVRGEARSIGLEQFASCAGCLTAMLAPEDILAIQLQHKVPGLTVDEGLRQAVRDIDFDRLDAAHLDRWRVDHIGEFAESLPDALWRAGLLGVDDATLEDGHARFFSLMNSEPALPTGSTYVFHPTLIDALGLRHGGPNDLPTTPVIEAP